MPSVTHAVDGRRRLSWCLFLCYTIWLMGGCGEVQSPAVQPMSESAVIIIPGYYGTRLAESTTGKLVWISVWEALFETRSLTIPLEDLGIHDAVQFKTDGILNDIPVLPFIYSIDGYGSLMRSLEQRLGPRITIVPLAYDWRLDILDAVAELDRTVTRLRDHGVQRIALVAHSLGGLVAAYYLRYGRQEPDQAVENWAGASRVNAVVLAGVPYRGSMTTFRNMQYGRRIGPNTSLLTSEAVSSFPASYYLLPAPGWDLLISPGLEQLTGLLYEPDNWNRYGWGLLRGCVWMPKSIVDNRAAYTEKWLTHVRRFFDLLHRPAQVTSQPRLPLMAVTGTGVETLAAGFWLGPHASVAMDLFFDKEQVNGYDPALDHTRLLRDGDGTVTMASAALPEAYRAAMVVEHRAFPLSHSALVRDGDLLNAIATFLSTAWERP